MGISVLPQYMGYMKIVYRKGSENDSDAINTQEDLADLTEESIIDNHILNQKFEDSDAAIFEKELEDLRECLMELTQLHCDEQLVEHNCNGYLQDRSFNGVTLPAGVTLDPNNGLYWITDIFVSKYIDIEKTAYP